MIAIFTTELSLIFKQKRTYYGLAAIFVIEVFIIVGAWYQGSDIISVLLENLSKSFYLEGELMNGNLVLYIVLNSLWFNLPLIIMLLVSGFITNDIKDGILQLIMLQSVSKYDYIIAKYLVSIVFTLFVLVFLFTSSAALAYAIFGAGDLITYLGGLNFFGSDDALIRIIFAFLSGGLLLIFYSVVSITFAILFRENTITWIICAFFLIANNLLLKIDFGLDSAMFFPKLIDTWQYFFYYEIPWKKIYINNIFLMGYSFLCAMVGTFYFVRRDIG